MQNVHGGFNFCKEIAILDTFSLILASVEVAQLASVRVQLVREVEAVGKAVHDLLLVVVQRLLAHVELLCAIVERETFDTALACGRVHNEDAAMKLAPLVDDIYHL